MMETAESYRAYWSTMTGKPEREIYVPVALTPFRPTPGATVRDEWGTGVITVTRGLLVEVRWSNGETTTESPNSFDADGVLLP
jgi:hypothetical protein